MAPFNRAIGRTVHFYDHSSADNNSIGGLVLNPSFTQANFLTCLDILIIAPVVYEVRRRGSDQTVARIDSRLEPGEYDIICPGRFPHIFLYTFLHTY